MTLDKVDMYLFSNAKNFPQESIPLVRERLAQLDESKFAALAMVDVKDPTMMLVISFFVGTFGVDRFMMGDIGLGVLKLLTGGLCGILTIIDWFTIMRRTRERNLNQLMILL